jgi:hypothetical protein
MDFEFVDPNLLHCANKKSLKFIPPAWLPNKNCFCSNSFYHNIEIYFLFLENDAYTRFVKENNYLPVLQAETSVTIAICGYTNLTYFVDRASLSFPSAKTSGKFAIDKAKTAISGNDDPSNANATKTIYEACKDLKKLQTPVIYVAINLPADDETPTNLDRIICDAIKPGYLFFDQIDIYYKIQEISDLSEKSKETIDIGLEVKITDKTYSVISAPDKKIKFVNNENPDQEVICDVQTVYTILPFQTPAVVTTFCLNPMPTKNVEIS